MKAQITITWNPESGEETRVSFSEAWRNLSGLEKADNLKDALFDLEGAYNRAIEEMQNDFKNIRAKAIRSRNRAKVLSVQTT